MSWCHVVDTFTNSYLLTHGDILYRFSNPELDSSFKFKVSSRNAWKHAQIYVYGRHKVSKREKTIFSFTAIHLRKKENNKQTNLPANWKKQ